MKPILSLLCSFLVFEGRLMAGLADDIPQSNQVVMASGQWRPSANDTQKALTAIQSFLEKPGSNNDTAKREIEQILQHTKEYRVQFVGVVRNRKRFIRCNFFPAREGFDYWRQKEVIVSDGGFWFWQVEFDLSTEKCVDFISNGYA